MIEKDFICMPVDSFYIITINGLNMIIAPAAFKFWDFHKFLLGTFIQRFMPIPSANPKLLAIAQNNLFKNNFCTSCSFQILLTFLKISIRKEQLIQKKKLFKNKNPRSGR